MASELKKVMSMINEKESQNREMLSKIEIEITETRAKLDALRSSVDKAESSEQYKDIMKEIRDYEDVLKFCEKKRDKASTSAFTDTEYKAILAEIKKAWDASKASYKKSIIADLEKLTQTLTQWDATTADLNGVSTRVAQLSNGKTPVLYAAQTISDGDEVIQAYIATFYRMKAFLIASGREKA